MNSGTYFYFRANNCSLVTLFYLVFSFICFTIHMIFADWGVHIKRIWGVLIVTSGVIIIARFAFYVLINLRYIYQFPGVDSKVNVYINNNCKI